MLDTLRDLLAVLLTEVERLIAEVESHLDYEETQLIPALDATTP